jgi:tetratricopeptide (TPR) repeat protein
MTLSICFLAKNEERTLPRALRSVAGLADEVLVGDAGSTDRTARVAADLGARVVPVAWQDDFSAGRNAVLDAAGGDWVLWLNPDEELLPDGRGELNALLGRGDALAYSVRVRDLPQADRPERFSETEQVRLFRRRPGLRFVGRLHPHFAAAPPATPAPLVVRRHVYESALTPDKLRWAARLLELELRDRPGQLHYQVEYGRTLLLLNDPRGHEILGQAAEQLRAARDAPRPPGASAGPLLDYLMTVAPEQSRGPLSRAEAVELASRWFPRTPPVLWRLAEFAFQAGDFAPAAEVLEELVRLGRGGDYDRSAPFDPDVMGDAAVMNLGVCRLRLGQLERAEACFRQLLDSPGQYAKALQNLAVVEDLKWRAATKSGG